MSRQTQVRAATRESDDRRTARLQRRVVRQRSSVWLHRARHGCGHRGDDARRSGWVSGATAYTPGNAALIVAGDITQAEARALAEKHFGKWQGAATVRHAACGRAEDRRHVCSSSIAASHRRRRCASAPSARHAVRPTTCRCTVMNDVLGGHVLEPHQPESAREERLYVRRELRVRIPARRRAVRGAANVRTDVTAPAVKEVFNEIARCGQRIGHAELTLSKDSFIRSLPGQFETTGDAAASVGAVRLRPATRLFHSLPAHIEAVRRRRAARHAVTSIRRSS